MKEGILKGICQRGMGSGSGLSHAQEVVVLLPGSTCTQEPDLKPDKCKRSSAGKWLLESHLLTGTDWERAQHHDPESLHSARYLCIGVWGRDCLARGFYGHGEKEFVPLSICRFGSER